MSLDYLAKTVLYVDAFHCFQPPQNQAGHTMTSSLGGRRPRHDSGRQRQSSQSDKQQYSRGPVPHRQHRDSQSGGGRKSRHNSQSDGFTTVSGGRRSRQNSQSDKFDKTRTEQVRGQRPESARAAPSVVASKGAHRPASSGANKPSSLVPQKDAKSGSVFTFKKASTKAGANDDTNAAHVTAQVLPPGEQSPSTQDSCSKPSLQT